METKILQFGEGNFLRCFIDWMVQKMNDRAGFDGKVQIIQPIGDELSVPSKILNDRGGKYHTCLRGIIGGKTVEEIEEISSVAGVDVAANVEKPRSPQASPRRRHRRCRRGCHGSARRCRRSPRR